MPQIQVRGLARGPIRSAVPTWSVPTDVHRKRRGKVMLALKVPAYATCVFADRARIGRTSYPVFAYDVCNVSPKRGLPNDLNMVIYFLISISLARTILLPQEICG